MYGKVVTSEIAVLRQTTVPGPSTEEEAEGEEEEKEEAVTDGRSAHW